MWEISIFFSKIDIIIKIHHVLPNDTIIKIPTISSNPIGPKTADVNVRIYIIYAYFHNV